MMMVMVMMVMAMTMRRYSSMGNVEYVYTLRCPDRDSNKHADDGDVSSDDLNSSHEYTSSLFYYLGKIALIHCQ